MNEAPGGRKKEPGNALGALGLILAGVGGGRLVFEIPPDALSLSRGVALVLCWLGAGLLVAGLVKEWRGPRRWSALLPGVLALTVGGLVAASGLSSEADRPEVDRVKLAAFAAKGAASATVRVSKDRSGLSEACALVIGGAEGVADAVASGLARLGIVTAVSQELSGSEAQAVQRMLSAQTGAPCSLVLDGREPSAVALLSATEAFDRHAVLSAPAADGFRPADPVVPTLYLFGAADGWGHQQASALMGDLSSDDAVVRVFLAADREFLTPRDEPWRQPGVLAEGFVDMLARWIRTGEA